MIIGRSSQETIEPLLAIPEALFHSEGRLYSGYRRPRQGCIHLHMAL